MQTEIAERFLDLSPDRQEALLDELTPAEQAELDRALGVLLAPRFVDFVRTVNPSLLRFEHIPRLLDVLQQVADDKIRRLMVLMPPRYFKSESVSRLFSAYYVYRHPKRWVGITSYGANLAWELNGQGRTYYQHASGEGLGNSKSVKMWETGKGGGVWADGAGGALLGRGYHLGIIDDPIKPEDALSETYQERFTRWYPSTFLSRAEPDAAIVVVMQRLAEWDPVLWLWEREMQEETAEGWHVVCCDEIRSLEPLTPYADQGWTGPMNLPPSCTLEDDPRKEGEALAPSRYPLKEAKRKQAKAGPVVASAQAQQRPQAPSGNFWRREWFTAYDELPPDAFNGGRSWDTAYTENRTNAASATVKSYRGPDRWVELDDRRENHFRIYIDDLDWQWLEEPDLVAWIKATKGPHYIEAKATGKSAVSWLKSAEIIAQEVEVRGGNKLQRSSGVQHVVSDGRVLVRRSLLHKLLEGPGQGLLYITAERLLKDGAGLDLNDAFVQELQRHVGGNDWLLS